MEDKDIGREWYVNFSNDQTMKTMLRTVRGLDGSLGFNILYTRLVIMMVCLLGILYFNHDGIITVIRLTHVFTILYCNYEPSVLNLVLS